MKTRIDLLHPLGLPQLTRTIAQPNNLIIKLKYTMDRTQEPETITVTIDGKPAGSMAIPSLRDPHLSVLLTFHPGTTATTGLHWHESHTEYLSIISGRARVRLGTSVAIFGPEDGTITIPRGMLHEYGRAEPDAPEDLVVREWTEPADGGKEVFFRNVMGTINARESGVFGNIKLLLGLFTVMHEHDNYPVFWVERPVWLRRRVSYAVLGAVAFVGRWCGFRGTDGRFAARGNAS